MMARRRRVLRQRSAQTSKAILYSQEGQCWGSGRCWYGGVVAYSSGNSEESLASCVAVVFPAESTLLKKVKFAEGAVVLLAEARHEARTTDEDP